MCDGVPEERKVVAFSYNSVFRAVIHVDRFQFFGSEVIIYKLGTYRKIAFCSSAAISVLMRTQNSGSWSVIIQMSPNVSI